MKMNGAPKFSVIVPICNAEKYLEQCLRSLINQTYRDIEIICVINGSSDRSEDIVNEFCSKDDRIRCEVLATSGVCRARNFGIQIARGEYIAFLDADDWVDQDLYNLVDKDLKHKEVDCLIFGIWNVRGNKIIRNVNSDRLLDKVGQSTFTYWQFPNECINIKASCWNKIYRRKFLLEKSIFFGEDLRSAEDTVFWLELCFHSIRMTLLPKPLYFYRISPNGVSATTQIPLSEIGKSSDYGLSRLGEILPPPSSSHKQIQAIVIERFLKTMLYAYRRMGQPQDAESISSLYVQYNKLPWRFCFWEQDTKWIAFEILLKYRLNMCLAKVFSFRKTPEYRIYNVLGFQFKVQRSSFRKKIKARKVLFDQYESVLQRLRQNKGESFRVGFMVAWIQKWKCQTLFDKMVQESCFTPIIVIVPIFQNGDTFDHVERRMAEAQEFFRAKNMNFVVAWDYQEKKPLPLEFFDLAVVFYQQPWGIRSEHEITNVAKKMLTYYVPYYVPNYGNLKYDCLPFHQQLFRYYVMNESWKALYLTVMKWSERQLCPVGHPTLDYYLANKKVKDKQYVIYAPHHSLTSQSICYGTFMWSGQLILNFAKLHPEINWLYKPHPALKNSLVYNNLMTPDAVETYWNDWKKIGHVYEGGDYLPIFNDSICLITDCGSFLVEYFYTGNPVIHLASGLSEIPVPALKEILDCYYSVTNKDELLQKMTDLLVNHQDSLGKIRLQKVERLLQNHQSCSSKIIEDMKSTLVISV